MVFKICPSEIGNEELLFKLRVEGDNVFLLPVLKCVLCASVEQILEGDIEYE